MNQVELQELHAKAIHDARQVIDLADKEGRSVTAEENERANQFFAEADGIEDKINTLNARQEVEAREARLKEVQPRKSSRAASRGGYKDEPNHKDAMRAWLSRGMSKSRLTGDQIENAARCGVDLSSNQLTLTRDASGMGVGITDNGADAVGWTEFYNGFVEKLKYVGPAIGLVSHHHSSTGNPLPITVLDDTSNVAAILAEGAEVTEALVGVDKVTLGSFKYESKEVPVSYELLQDANFNVSEYVMNALAVRFGRTFNTHITTGAGTTLPFGLTTRASNSSVVFGGTTSAPTLTFDNLIDMADSLDDAYRSGPNNGYMCHRTTLSKVRKLKDSANNYLWQPSLQAGNPGTINGYPVYVNPAMPVSGASAKIMLFGDFSQYMWRTVQDIQLMRLDEIRARYGEVVFLAFARADGNLLQPSAVVYGAAPAS